jgi:putative hydrolase of the HAD superfamily
METLSFDMDGTLITFDFTDAVWRKSLPGLYAEQKGIPRGDALALLGRAYDEMGDRNLEWYDLRYWLDLFSLDGDVSSLIMPHCGLIRTYPEVREVIRTLHEKFSLIIISSAAREFLDLEVEGSGLARFFDHTYSTTSDFGKTKEESVYRDICGELGVTAKDLIHVGDHHQFDYLVPRALGAEAYYLDRSGKEEGDSVIRDLTELLPRLGL